MSARGQRHFNSRHSRSPFASCSEALRPYRHLAVRVIDQALRDLASPVGSTVDRESARAFLSGSAGLRDWCELAALDPQWVVIQLRKVLAWHNQVEAAAGSVRR
jgi:hypothetical protein